MRKIYCDFCGEEILRSNKILNNKLDCQLKKSDLFIDIDIIIPEHNMPADCCKYCVFDAIANLDDRPRETFR